MRRAEVRSSGATGTYYTYFDFPENRRDKCLKVWQHGIMSPAIVDMHRLFSDLKQRGFTDQQAEGVAEAIAEIDLSQLASKADLQGELRQLEIRMIKWMIPLLLGQTAAFGLIVNWLVG